MNWPSQRPVGRGRAPALPAVLAVTLGPVAVACALGLWYPHDPIWFAFSNVGVLLAGVLRSARAALAVAMVAIVCVLATALLHVDSLGSARIVPMVMFDLMFSALIV